VQCIALLAIVHVRMKHLHPALGQKLAAMPGFLVGDVAIVALPGKLIALPEIHHIDEVFKRILGPDEPERDQPFAPQQIKAGERPSHRGVLNLDAGVARAVADFLGRHPRLDFAKQRGIAIIRHHIGEHHISRHGKQLRFLHRARHAQPIGFVGARLNKIVGFKKLRVADAARTHRTILPRISLFAWLTWRAARF
jgi:hypothetical protein